MRLKEVKCTKSKRLRSKGRCCTCMCTSMRTCMCNTRICEVNHAHAFVSYTATLSSNKAAQEHVIMLTQPGPHSAENKAETPPLLAVERVHQQGDGLGTEGCRCSRAGLYAACAQRDVKQGKSEALGPWHGSHVLSCKVHCKVLICSLKPSFTASPLIL